MTRDFLYHIVRTARRTNGNKCISIDIPGLALSFPFADALYTCSRRYIPSTFSTAILVISSLLCAAALDSALGISDSRCSCLGAGRRTRRGRGRGDEPSVRICVGALRMDWGTNGGGIPRAASCSIARVGAFYAALDFTLPARNKDKD